MGRRHKKGSAVVGIYVEIFIRGSIDEIWEKTQTPQLHQRWDMRFTEITYLPHSDEQPQRFLYSTRIGFGLRICGEGETVAAREDPQGQRTSSLKFWSDDPKSLIREGTGYWQYVPHHDGVRFLTWYDYRTRFGWPGQVFDNMIFRPLIGWATAWSFDRLRLWIEQGIDPAVSLQRSLVYSMARLTVAFVWLYHGLIPKLLFHHPDELAILAQSGLSPEAAQLALNVIGVVEIAFALILLAVWRNRKLLLLNIGLMLLALVGVAVNAPSFLIAAFNPVTLNICMIALAIIGCLSGYDLPSASACLRKPPEREE